MKLKKLLIYGVLGYGAFIVGRATLETFK